MSKMCRIRSRRSLSVPVSATSLSQIKQKKILSLDAPNLEPGNNMRNGKRPEPVISLNNYGINPKKFRKGLSYLLASLSFKWDLQREIQNLKVKNYP